MENSKQIKQGKIKPSNSSSSETFFFHLSALHPVLPVEEIIAILKGKKTRYKILEQQEKYLILKCPSEQAKQAMIRAAYCKRGGELLLKHPLEQPKIKYLETTINRNIDFKKEIDSGESFLVRAYHLANKRKSLNTAKIEPMIGQIIYDQTDGKCRANLEQPTKKFDIFLSETQFFIVRENNHQLEKRFSLRRPDLRPFFRPGTMKPRFARLMVNLSGVKANEWVVDPFCGPGGILLEAAFIGCKTLGSDISKEMIRGAKANFDHYNLSKNASFMLADAKNLPIAQPIKAIVSDPPYGRATSTYGKAIEKLLVDFLEDLQQLITKETRVVLGMSKKIDLEKLLEKAGLELILHEQLYIHGSLTRQIGVCQRK